MRTHTHFKRRHFFLLHPIESDLCKRTRSSVCFQRIASRVCQFSQSLRYIINDCMKCSIKVSNFIDYYIKPYQYLIPSLRQCIFVRTSFTRICILIRFIVSSNKSIDRYESYSKFTLEIQTTLAISFLIEFLV